jgi:hypothetical protein
LPFFEMSDLQKGEGKCQMNRRYPVIIEDGDQAPAVPPAKPAPSPEEDDGDIATPKPQPADEDDQPLE